MIGPGQVELVDELAPFGIHAFTTNRSVGSFSALSAEPIRDVMARWDAVRAIAAERGIHRLASARQVHGADVIVHVPGWRGWLRGDDGDGHASTARGTALAVSIADCVPIFVAHPGGAVALLHSGWRGTAAGIIERGLAALTHRGVSAAELRIHLGPAICGKCYEVSPEVVKALSGRVVGSPETVDLRALIAAQARQLGVTHVSTSASCTRCHNDKFFSHRAGDAGRQIAVIMS